MLLPQYDVFNPLAAHLFSHLDLGGIIMDTLPNVFMGKITEKVQKDVTTRIPTWSRCPPCLAQFSHICQSQVKFQKKNKKPKPSNKFRMTGP